MAVSRTRLDRAGRALSRWWAGDDTEAFEPGTKLWDCAGDVIEYRASFQHPLNKVTVGVRQFVERESAQVVVAQRLKRMPAILNKLVRFDSMRLTQMEDIGGCRAILASRAEVAGVRRRIRRNWDVVFERDYVGHPKSTGYRANHIVIVRDERAIEIQLRTPGQHEWAEAVERAAARTGYDLKDGNGPAELVTYFELAAWAIAIEEAGGAVDEGFERVFRNLRKRVEPYFERQE